MLFEASGQTRPILSHRHFEAPFRQNLERSKGELESVAARRDYKPKTTSGVPRVISTTALLEAWWTTSGHNRGNVASSRAPYALNFKLR